MRFRFTLAVFPALILMAGAGRAALAATPRIVALNPPDGADDVDPGLTTLEIQFDQGVFSGAGGVCFDTPGRTSPVTRVGWKASNVFSVTVQLQPDTVYEFTIGCPENQRFQSPDGEVIEPAKWRFATRGWAPPEQQRAINEAALDEAKQMLKDFFVHLDRRGIDWERRYEEMRSRILEAPGNAAWMFRMAELYSIADDPMVWMMYNGAPIRTNKRPVHLNFRQSAAETTIGPLKKHGDYVYTGRTDDGVGYLLVYSWHGVPAETIPMFDRVLSDMSDTKALIVDVRANEGGDAQTAIAVASWFVKGEALVLKYRLRDPSQPSGMSQTFERTIAGNDAPKQYNKRVAILMGGKTMGISEWFILASRHGRRVRTFGAKTRGSSGYGKAKVLSNGVQLCVPSARDMLPDGSPMDGITPDHPVETKDGDFRTSDPVLEAALTALRKRMK
ncbi:MAG TPA: S41 family peptidase [Phycisphaerae bacterium]|nr:S41 family peptidase [Phycisphaerae bacterium]HRW56080.1 S41 family peptidase [Phycisphaerae bacterium]